ncbi:MAG: hypothetical protein R3D71_04190 [Rickettsiales bacterium]
MQPKENKFLFKPFVVLVICWAFISPSFVYAKTPEDLSFHGQCPKLLAMADDFAKECLEKARPLSRVFLPTRQREKHGAYFRAIDSGSRFGLGCTLDHEGKLRFVGIYYSTKSSNFKEANTSPFAFIDFSGNVGLKINGEFAVLTAVRRFVTDFIPSPYKPFDPKSDPDAVVDPNRLPPVKNCENEQSPDGRIRMVNGGAYKITESIDDKGRIMIKRCDRHEVFCVAEYLSFFPSNDRRIIYSDGSSDIWFINAGGDLLVKKNWLANHCTPLQSISSQSLYQEVCNLPSLSISKKDKK